MSGSGRIEFVLHPAVHLDQRTHICTDGRIQEFPPESVYDAHTAQKTERYSICVRGTFRMSNDGGYRA